MYSKDQQVRPTQRLFPGPTQYGLNKKAVLVARHKYNDIRYLVQRWS